MTETQWTSAHIPRRSLARGVAWTVPAIALAQAAPAFAASVLPPIFSSVSGKGTCYQADNQFGFWFTLKATQSLTITSVTVTTPNYSALSNHAPQWYITNQGNKVPKPTKPWTITANATTDINIAVQYDGGSKWPVSKVGGASDPTGDGSGFFAPGATFTQQTGRVAISICLSGTDASNNPISFCITMPAGYPLPLPTEGHCPSNQAPTYVNGDTHYVITKVPSTTVNVNASATCPC